MERQQRRRQSSGREHRPGSSRRPYSDEQETYRNPRDEYRHDPARQYGDDAEIRQPGSSYYADSDEDDEESERYAAREGGYGYGDADYRQDRGQRSRGERGSRDTWMEPESGNFSDERTRWPRDERYRSEPRSRNWPHSRTGGRVSEYGYFGEAPGRSVSWQQGGSREGFGSRPQGGYGGYGGQQENSQPGYGGREQPGFEDRSRRFDEDYSGRGPRSYSRSDERIKEDVCDELSADRECNAEDVDIEVKDGVVTLSGTVPSRKMKHRAEDIADATRGVKDVENRIRVTGRNRGGSDREERNEGVSNGPSQKKDRQSSKSRQ